MGTREDLRRVKVVDPSLGDLRWLVEQTRDCDPDSRVEVIEARDHGPLRGDPAQIIVVGKPAKPGRPLSRDPGR